MRWRIRGFIVVVLIVAFAVYGTLCESDATYPPYIP